MHVSVWQDGKNMFEDAKGELGMSALAYQFLGGVMHSAADLCAFFNPTVNSYKRINAPVTSSGATWSPNTVTYSGNNRTHMVRIPEAGRFELRLMDWRHQPLSGSRGGAGRRARRDCTTSAIPASGWTSTCTRTVTRSRMSNDCRSICSTR